MTRPLSDDLRRRVVTAVGDGMPRRGAAKRFGIAPSTAIKWVRVWRLAGSYRPRPQGGDNRSHRIEARAETVLALVEETPDMTLAEIAAYLENEHGLRVYQSTVWRFFHRCGITFKKRLTPASSNVLMCCDAGAPGPRPSPALTLKGSSSSMRRAYPPRWRGAAAGLCAEIGAGRPCLTATVRPGALRLNGMTAPMVLDGAMHGAAFLAYVDQDRSTSCWARRHGRSWTTSPLRLPGSGCSPPRVEKNR